MADAMKKTTLRLPTELWKAAQHRAVDEDIDLQELVARAIELYLKTKPERGGSR
jgi:predicted HicB family RNase H-like nuclease